VKSQITQFDSEASHHFMKTSIAILMMLGFCSCQTTQNRIVVDISEQRLRIFNGSFLPVFSTKIETARKGIGTKIGSNKTPTGNYTARKEPNHRYGPSIRLSGYQGNSRGILIHRDFIRGNGTSGCICPTSRNAMLKVFNLVENDTPILIKQ